MKNTDLMYKPEEGLEKIYPGIYKTLRSILPNATFYLHGSSLFRHIFTTAAKQMKKEDADLIHDTYTSNDIDIVVVDNMPYKKFLKVMNRFKPVIDPRFRSCSFGWSGPEGKIIDMWYRRPTDIDYDISIDVAKFPHTFASTLDQHGITPSTFAKVFITLRRWACRQYVWSKRFLSNTALWMCIAAGNEFGINTIHRQLTVKSIIVGALNAMIHVSDNGGMKSMIKDNMFITRLTQDDNIIYLYNTPAVTMTQSNKYILLTAARNCLDLIQDINDEIQVLRAINDITPVRPNGIVIAFTIDDPKDYRLSNMEYNHTMLKKKVNPTLKYLFDVPDKDKDLLFTRPYDYMVVSGRRCFIAIGTMESAGLIPSQQQHDYKFASLDDIIRNTKEQIEWAKKNTTLKMEILEWSPIADMMMSYTAMGMIPLPQDSNKHVESLFSPTTVPKLTQHAYVFLLMHGDRYTPGIIAGAHSIRMTGSKKDIVVMITDDVTDDAVNKLRPHVTRIIRVPYVQWKALPMKGAKQRDMYKVWANSAFTKGLVHFLTDYDKVMFVDADMVLTKNCDHLFEMNTPLATFSRREARPYTTEGLYNPYTVTDATHQSQRIRSYKKRNYRRGGYSWWTGGGDSSHPHRPLPINHGETIPYNIVNQAIKRGWFVMIAAMFMVSPDNHLGLHYLELVTRNDVYNDGNEPPISAPDEVSISHLYVERRIDWTQLGVIYNWIPWNSEGWLKHTKWTPDDVHVVHFFGTEKPWEMSKDKYDDIKLWWDIYDSATKVLNL